MMMSSHKLLQALRSLLFEGHSPCTAVEHLDLCGRQDPHLPSRCHLNPCAHGHGLLLAGVVAAPSHLHASFRGPVLAVLIYPLEVLQPARCSLQQVLCLLGLVDYLKAALVCEGSLCLCL